MRKLPQEELYTKVRSICSVFNIVKNTKEQILKNLEMKVDDFEDGLQYQAALDAKCDVIITRNQKDFRFSTIPIMTPKDYLESISY